MACGYYKSPTKTDAIVSLYRRDVKSKVPGIAASKPSRIAASMMQQKIKFGIFYKTSCKMNGNGVYISFFGLEGTVAYRFQ